MSAIMGIIVFVLGLAAGLGAAAGVIVLLKKATAELRRRNRRLETSAWEDRLEFETYKAYRSGYSRGYRRGRANPISDVERLAETIREKRMDFRGPVNKG